MSIKKNTPPSLRMVRKAAKEAYERKKKWCQRLSNEGNGHWHELEKFRCLKKVADNLNDVLYLELIADDTQLEAVIEMNTDQQVALGNLRNAMRQCEESGLWQLCKREMILKVRACT